LNVEFSDSELAQALRGDQSQISAANKALNELLARTDARAVGLWRLEADHLLLVGFAATPKMAQEVQDGFVDATRKVSLKQTKLGIVSAVMRRGPAVAIVNPQPDGLVDSASWLVKFEAVQSLSVPIVQDDQIQGVLAVSTAHSFVEGGDLWNVLTELAKRIGR
jgi:GAF domain-containing protein